MDKKLVVIDGILETMLHKDTIALLRIVRAAEKIYETTEDGYMFKHILVEGEGDKWHIPETMGLALAEALEALPEHLRGEG